MVSLQNCSGRLSGVGCFMNMFGWHLLYEELFHRVERKGEEGERERKSERKSINLLCAHSQEMYGHGRGTTIAPTPRAVAVTGRERRHPHPRRYVSGPWGFPFALGDDDWVENSTRPASTAGHSPFRSNEKAAAHLVSFRNVKSLNLATFKNNKQRSSKFATRT